jgi:hypothetical protein
MKSSTATIQPVKRGPGRPPKNKAFPNNGEIQKPKTSQQVKKKLAKNKFFAYDDPLSKKFIIAREHLDGHIEVLLGLPTDGFNPEESMVFDFKRIEQLPVDPDEGVYFSSWETPEEAELMITNGREQGFPDFDPNAIAKAVVVSANRIFDTVYKIVFDELGNPGITFYRDRRGSGNSVELVVREYIESLEQEWKAAIRAHDQHYADTVKPIMDKMNLHSDILMGRVKK